MMSEGVCLDANVVLTALSPDECTEEKLRLFDDILHSRNILWMPALVNFEVGLVLAKKRKLHEWGETELSIILEVFFKLPLILVWNKELILKALSFQQQGIPSFHDACYLAMAALKQIPLITEDQELYKRGKRLYPQILTLHETL